MDKSTLSKNAQLVLDEHKKEPRGYIAAFNVGLPVEDLLNAYDELEAAGLVVKGIGMLSYQGTALNTRILAKQRKQVE